MLLPAAGAATGGGPFSNMVSSLGLGPVGSALTGAGLGANAAKSFNESLAHVRMSGGMIKRFLQLGEKAEAGMIKRFLQLGEKAEAGMIHASTARLLTSRAKMSRVMNSTEDMVQVTDAMFVCPHVVIVSCGSQTHFYVSMRQHSMRATDAMFVW